MSELGTATRKRVAHHAATSTPSPATTAPPLRPRRPARGTGRRLPAVFLFILVLLLCWLTLFLQVSRDHRGPRALPNSRVRTGGAAPPAPPVSTVARKLRTAAKKSGGKIPDDDVIPFVIMAFQRVDYLKQSLASLKNSDFPAANPILVSIDGHVPAMTDYVESMRGAFNLTVVHHPFSCHDHPDAFPGFDAALNVGYGGDQYGNPRSRGITCLKHHWLWMMRASWTLFPDADALFFTEEDYEYAPSVFGVLAAGLGRLEGDQFGVVLENPLGKKGFGDGHSGGRSWMGGHFRSGPMAIPRDRWHKILAASEDFCTFDDYNWDWSVVHLMALDKIPSVVLYPPVPQTRHIGITGLHGVKNKEQKKTVELKTIENPGALQRVGTIRGMRITKHRGYGGWGHPKDHAHCMDVAHHDGILYASTVGQ